MVFNRFLRSGLLVVGIALSMNAFSSELTLFSPVAGIVVLDGKPVASALVTREFTWSSEKRRTDSVFTDLQGHFAFPAITRKSLFWKIIPHNPSVVQEIKITFESRDYIA